MSLEAQLAELNTNIKALTEAVSKRQGAALPTLAAAPSAESGVTDTKAGTAASGADAKEEKATAKKQEADAATPAQKEDDAPVDYKQVSAAVLRYLAATDKDRTSAFLKQVLKVDNAKQLKPEQYRDALAKINAKLAEVEA